VSRTAGGRASWLKASWYRDEAGGTQTAPPERLCREEKAQIRGCCDVT